MFRSPKALPILIPIATCTLALYGVASESVFLLLLIQLAVLAFWRERTLSTKVFNLRERAKNIARARRTSRHLLEELPAASVIVVDNIFHVSKAALKLTGFERADVARFEDWFVGIRENQRQFAGPAPDEFDLSLLNGTKKTLRFSKSEDGKTEIWILQDVSEKTQSHEHFRVLFERSSEPHLLFDNDGIIDCNDAAAHAMGCHDRAHLMSLHLAIFRPEYQPDGRRSDEKAAEIFRRAAAKGVHRCEWTQKLYSGEIVEVSIVMSAVQYQGRQAFLSVWHDITAQKRMEKTVRDQQLFLQSLIDHMPVALYCKDVDDESRYMVWNRSAEKLWGLAAKDVIGRRDEDLFPERVASAFGRRDEQLKELGQVIESEDRSGTQKDAIILRNVNVPLPDSTGRTRYLLGFTEDITTRKRIEGALLEREAAMNEAQKIAKTGSYEFDLNTEDGFWTAQAAINFGLPPETPMLAAKWLERIHPEDLPNVIARREQAAATGIAFDESYRVVRPDGSTVILQGYGKPVFDGEGRLVRWVGTIQDVTEQKHQEQTIRSQEVLIFQSSKMSALGEMAGGIAHEINNPLAIIQTAAEQLGARAENGELDPPRVSKIIDRIMTTTERIAKIIQSLRTFARDGRNDPLVPGDLRAVLDETLEFCQNRFKNHGVEFEIVSVAGQLPIQCRPVQLSQVILNLLNNAFDACQGRPRQKITVELRTNEQWCELRVTDTGSGIPKNIRDRIFNPFFTTKEVGKGTGLGLSISAEIIRGHFGVLSLDDKSSDTTFVLLLPREANASQEAA